jgi:sugar lactone lactonase YvrE
MGQDSVRRERCDRRGTGLAVALGRLGSFDGAMLTVVLVLSAAAASAAARQGEDHILVEGVPIVGSANGMYFDGEDRLHVANVLGQSISVLDPDSGDILDRLGPAEGVFFPDDLAFAPDGTLFWTDTVFGLVQGLTSAGAPFTVAAGFPSANPITVSDDGRLFFAQCFNAAANGIFEADPTGAVPPSTIRQDGPGCASNGMDWWDGALYAPRWFENRVVRVDIDTGALTDVTTGWPVPAAVKFDSQGRLHGVSQGNGEVVRIDLATGTREVLATLPIGLDNLAFDSSDRLFVSSSSDAFVVEVLGDGSVRTVSPGGMNIPLGLAVVDGVVHVGELQTLRSFDANDGEPIGVTRSVFGVGPLPLIPLAASPLDDERLILADWFDGELAVWNLAQQQAEVEAAFPAPVDAVPFRGGVAVSELGTGRVVLASGPDFSQRETLASGLFVPAGLAARRDEDLYVSDSALGTVLQIVRDGEVLQPPEPVTDETFSVPEGIALRNRNHLLVVEGATGILKEVNLQTGRVRIFAEGLGFQPYSGIPGFPPFQGFNHVEVDEAHNVYVNGDGANVIYKFEDDDVAPDMD